MTSTFRLMPELILRCLWCVAVAATIMAASVPDDMCASVDGADWMGVRQQLHSVVVWCDLHVDQPAGLALSNRYAPNPQPQLEQDSRNAASLLENLGEVELIEHYA